MCAGWLALCGGRSDLPERDFENEPLRASYAELLLVSAVLPPVLSGLVVDYCAAFERDADWFACVGDYGYGRDPLRPVSLSHWTSIALLGQPEDGGRAFGRELLSVGRGTGLDSVLNLFAPAQPGDGTFSDEARRLSKRVRCAHRRAEASARRGAFGFEHRRQIEEELFAWILHVLPAARFICLQPDADLWLEVFRSLVLSGAMPQLVALPNARPLFGVPLEVQRHRFRSAAWTLGSRREQGWLIDVLA